MDRRTQSVVNDYGDVATLTYEPLSVEAITKSVSHDGAGATATFVGTTRDNFNGQIVTHLEYEAYPQLALKTLKQILDEARTTFTTNQPPTLFQTTYPLTSTQTNPSSSTIPHLVESSFTKLVIRHLLGSCPVGQTSIIIAVSSPHRRESFQVCEWALEQVKEKVQIWKRECYQQTSSTIKTDGLWKENFPPA